MRKIVEKNEKAGLLTANAIARLSGRDRRAVATEIAKQEIEPAKTEAGFDFYNLEDIAGLFINWSSINLAFAQVDEARERFEKAITSASWHPTVGPELARLNAALKAALEAGPAYLVDMLADEESLS
jgi:hypothetical protein